MKSKPETRSVPKPDDATVAERFPRPRPRPSGEKEVIFLRVAGSEKNEIEASAKAVDLNVTEYLLRCHEVVSEKLKERERGDSRG